jgi:hypothetical protein
VNETRFISPPFTRTAAGVLGELTIPSDNAAPAVVGDCNVIITNNREKAPQKLCLMGRISGTAEATAVVTLKWFVYHHTTLQFYTAATMTIVGSSGITDTLGNILVINHNPQCQRGYIQATGLLVNQALNVVVDQVLI